jgi:hypothetical protein
MSPTALRRFKWNTSTGNLRASLTYFSQGKRFSEPSQGLNWRFRMFSGSDQTAPKTIDEYIAGFPQDVQEILEKISMTI